jgi:peptide/nickel transport system permease protein
MKNMLSPLLTLWMAITLAFITLRAVPGDGIEARLRQTGASAADIQRQRESLGMDDPLPIQYLHYWGNLLRGDLGTSLVTREKVTAMITARLVPTFELAGAALTVAVLWGLLLGTFSARPSQFRPVAQGVTALTLAAPAYWTATLVIYAASRPPLVSLELPIGGTTSPGHLILPSLVLGFHVGGGIARVVESALRESYQAEFIQTARAKGLTNLMIYRHALRASLPPLLSIAALQAGFLLGGTVMIEMIFTRRGLGSLMLQAVTNQDYPLVQGLVLVGALAYTLTRAIAALLTYTADPRLNA